LLRLWPQLGRVNHGQPTNWDSRQMHLMASALCGWMVCGHGVPHRPNYAIPTYAITHQTHKHTNIPSSVARNSKSGSR